MTVQDYLELPYTVTIRHISDDSGSYYYATVAELDGCMSDGNTYAEAIRNIQEAMEGWIETCLDHGFPVPTPEVEPRYNSRFILHLPKTLHTRIVREAKAEGVSLNQYALYKLSS